MATWRLYRHGPYHGASAFRISVNCLLIWYYELWNGVMAAAKRALSGRLCRRSQRRELPVGIAGHEDFADLRRGCWRRRVPPWHLSIRQRPRRPSLRLQMRPSGTTLTWPTGSSPPASRRAAPTSLGAPISEPVGPARFVGLGGRRRTWTNAPRGRACRLYCRQATRHTHRGHAHGPWRVARAVSAVARA